MVKDEYECGEFIVRKLGIEQFDPIKIKLPEEYCEILNAKKRMNGLIIKCECGEIGTPNYIKKKTVVLHSRGLVEYLDNKIEKCLCRNCAIKYENYERLAEMENSY